MCKCELCNNVIFLNKNIESQVIMSDTNNEKSNQVKLNIQPLFAILGLFYTMLKYIGFMFVGLIVGAGIVIKNPPQDTALVKKLQELEKENNNLKFKLTQDEFVTKESVVIK